MKRAALFTIVVFLIMIYACLTNKPQPISKTLSVESFLYVYETTSYTICTEEPCDSLTESSGSGFALHNTFNGTYGVTAGHLCQPLHNNPIIQSLTTTEIEITMLDGTVKDAEIIAIYPAHDICILFIKGARIPILEIAEFAPEIGDVVFSISAPMGMRDTNMVPIFDGYYSGVISDIDLKTMDTYSIPTAGGSSGSPILNTQGKVVGIVSRKPTRFDHLAFSPRFNVIHRIFNAIKEDYLPDE